MRKQDRLGSRPDRRGRDEAEGQGRGEALRVSRQRAFAKKCGIAVLPGQAAASPEAIDGGIPIISLMPDTERRIDIEPCMQYCVPAFDREGK